MAVVCQKKQGGKAGSSFIQKRAAPVASRRGALFSFLKNGIAIQFGQDPAAR
jgi:hypothetical protein